jgi:hypothetical protein
MLLTCTTEALKVNRRRRGGAYEVLAVWLLEHLERMAYLQLRDARINVCSRQDLNFKSNSALEMCDARTTTS